jgi:hypothetical protein
MHRDLHKILTDAEVFPVELTLTSGDKVHIIHPDFVFFSRKLGRIFFFPPDEQSIFETIQPRQVAKVRAKVKKSMG